MTGEGESLYALCGITRDCSQNEIKIARLAFLKTNREAILHAKTATLNTMRYYDVMNAFEIIQDPTARRFYDKFDKVYMKKCTENYYNIEKTNQYFERKSTVITLKQALKSVFE